MPDSEFSVESKEKSARPSDSQFVQQAFPTIRPILNTTTITPFLFFLSLIFIPLGVGIWLYSQNVGEVVIEYTNCISNEYPGTSCAAILFHDSSADCTCSVTFTVKDDELNKGNVYMYYYLTDYYYQNHLDFYTSKDENQLKGNLGKANKIIEPATKCGKLDERFLNDSGRFVLPCGALANYMFSDSIELYDNNDFDGIPSLQGRKVPLIRTGIAPGSDKGNKFKNPEPGDFTRDQLKEIFAPPPSWKKSLWELDPDDESNNGLLNEDFIVWMKVSALPNFRKLYRIVNTTEFPYENGLQPGKYTLEIEYNYDVTSNYTGTKSVILTTSSMIGAQNHFLGIAYLTTGGICLFLTISFFILHLCTQHKNKYGYTFDKDD